MKNIKLLNKKNNQISKFCNWIDNYGVFILLFFLILFFLVLKNKESVNSILRLPSNFKVHIVFSLPFSIPFYLIFMLVFSYMAFKFFFVFPYIVIKELLNSKIQSSMENYIEKWWVYIFLIFYLLLISFFTIHFFKDFSFYE